MASRITLKDIARECGVGVATVSYSLRKNNRIPKETRKRIQQVAKSMGYMPDPALSSLASRRGRGNSVPFQASVAILHPNPKSDRATQLFLTHCEYFRARMEELGCTVTDFEIDTEKYSLNRLAQIFKTRGIKGILLGWGQWPENIHSFPWDKFSIVSTERTDLELAGSRRGARKFAAVQSGNKAKKSPVDNVCMNYMHAVNDVFEKLDNHPGKNIGVILHHNCPEAISNFIAGGYYSKLYERPHLNKSIPFFYYRIGESPERLAKWYQEYKLDVIISHRVIDPAVFRNADISFPNPTGIVILEIDEPSNVRFSGLYTEGNLGRTIATLLARKIRNDEIDETPRAPKLTLVNGVWKDGETL